MSNVKVSVLMPSLNVGKFIRECMDSIVCQTLKDIEIICIDAGSTDGTLEILQEFAQKDERIKLIIADKKSYGYQMNLGLDASHGEYIGILETDDWAEPDMFEKLYKAAKDNNADMVRGNYYEYTTINGVVNKPFNNIGKMPRDTVIVPRDYPELFDKNPAIWTGLYKRSMIESLGIRFNETAGASYQDTSFYFMVYSLAESCVLISDHLLHYRCDNEMSSVHSNSKVFNIYYEMCHYEAFMEKYPDVYEKVKKPFQDIKHTKYQWNLYRLSGAAQYSFLKLMYKELKAAEREGLFDKTYFTDDRWNRLQNFLKDPVAEFHRIQKMRGLCKEERYGVQENVLKESQVENPLVTVVMPIFNREKYLAESLESVVNQTLQKIEIICVDDGSVDDSMEIVNRYTEKDTRISVIDMQINAGPSAARNAGILHAKGKYVYFLDSDDYILPQALEELYDRAERENTDILCFGSESIFEDEEVRKKHGVYETHYRRKPSFEEPVKGEVFMQDQMKKRLFRCNVWLQFIRADFLRKSGILFEEGIIHEDEPFSCLLTVKAERVLCISAAYHRRRVHGNSIVTNSCVIEKLRGLSVGYMTILAHLITDKSLSQTAKKTALARAKEMGARIKKEMQPLSRKDQEAVITGLPEEYRSIIALFPQGKAAVEAEPPKGFFGKLLKKTRSLLIRIRDEGVTETARYALWYAKHLWKRITTKG